MSTDKTDIDIVSVCANCGKGEEESGKLKSCTACKLVKYCNRECQIAHRPQHKKKNVRSKLLNYMMKGYLNNHRQRKIVQFVSYEYLHFIRVGDIMDAVVKLYAVDVFMHQFMITRAI